MPTAVGTPSAQYQASASSNTFSHTVPATGARRALRVFAAAFNGGGGSITGVTYAGVSMTKVGATFGTITSEGIAEQYILVNPSTGANNVVISASGSLSEIIGVASSWEDVDQTTPTSDSDGGTGSGAAPSISLTVTGSDVGCAGVEFFSANVDNPTQSDTLLAEIAAGAATTGVSDQYGDGTLSWTINSSSIFAYCGFTLVHDGGSDTTAPVLTSATGTATGSTTANVGATTDEGNGTMYAVVTTSSTTPSVAQIKAGQDHTGAAAVWDDTLAIGSTGAKTLGATGLSPSTGYYGHLVHTDAAANDSNTISSAQFTTDAAVNNKLAWITA